MTTELDRFTSPQMGSTTNPERDINTYLVDIMNTKTREIEEGLVTHNFSIEACVLDIKENLSESYELIYVYQPDSRLSLNKKQIEDL